MLMFATCFMSSQDTLLCMGLLRALVFGWSRSGQNVRWSWSWMLSGAYEQELRNNKNVPFLARNGYIHLSFVMLHLLGEKK